MTMKNKIEEDAMKRKTKCRYFNGPVHNKKCKAEIDYRQLVGGPDLGWMARLPCISNSPLRKQPLAKCNNFYPYSEDEILQQEKEMQERIMFLDKAFGDIKKYAKDKNINGGIINCPKCTGPLHFSIAKINGHIWGRCETEGCLQWMQ